MFAKVSYLSRGFVPMVDTLPIQSLSYTLRERTVGTMNIVLPPYQKFLDPSYFPQNGVFEIWLSDKGDTWQLEGDTCWFINKPARYFKDNGQKGVQVFAQSDLCVLGRRKVAYDAGTTYTEKLGYADDLMKDIVRENFGSSAFDANRNASSVITIDDNVSAGAIVGDSVAWRGCLEVIENFAQASYDLGVTILYDLKYNPYNHMFRFSTYKNCMGVDHSGDSSYGPVQVGIETRNLANVEESDDFTNSYNYVYALGKGEDQWRITAEAYDSELINQGGVLGRVEYVADAGDVVDPTKLARVANKALANGRPKSYFSGKLLPTGLARYGVHFKFGDLISAQSVSRNRDCRVSMVNGSYTQEKGYQVEIELKGEESL